MQKIVIVFSLALFANLLSAQNVGIGTNSPTSKLHVVGGVKVENSKLELVNSKLSFNDPFDNMSIGENTMQNYSNGQYNIGIGKFALSNFETGSGNIAVGHNAMEGFIDGGYNIGLGYNSLQSKSSDFCIAIGEGSNQGLNGFHNTVIGNGATVINGARLATAIGYKAVVGQDYSIVLGRSLSYVGIGTPTPSAQLALGGYNTGFSGDNTQLLLSGKHNLGTNIGSTDGTFKLKIEGYNNDDGLKVYPIYAIDENQQVDFYVQNRPSAGGSATLYIAGNAIKPGGGLWAASSDIRLKKEITPYKEGLEEINQIRPVRFKYNALSNYNTSEEHIGVIAQEIQKVAPHMVSEHEINGEGYLQVDNSSMVYMLINAVQELSTQVEELKEHNQKLERRIKLLEKESKLAAN